MKSLSPDLQAHLVDAGRVPAAGPALAAAGRELGEAKLLRAHVVERDPVLRAHRGKVGVVLVQLHRLATHCHRVPRGHRIVCPC